jgi:glycosyltransferase involved in cell wall biosynthesis
MNEVTEHIPLVSVGLPVFNGENYLAQAIESILGQTLTDLELIISDNASTDRTEEICRKFAAADPRVVYHRNPTNIGGARNQAVTVDLSRGRYVRLSAHDDLISPTFLEECVKVLEESPDVVISFTGTVVIDGEGEEVVQYRSDRGCAERPSQRFAQLAFRDHNCDAIYGVIRGDVVRATKPMENFIDGDKAFLCRLAMRGRFQSIPKPLFYKRFHPKNHVTNWRDRMAWYNPDAKGKVSFPNWLELGSFTSVAVGSKIGWGERLRCAGTTARWFLRYWPKLVKDLLVAAQTMWLRLRHRDRPGIYNWE